MQQSKSNTDLIVLNKTLFLPTEETIMNLNVQVRIVCYSDIIQDTKAQRQNEYCDVF